MSPDGDLQRLVVRRTIPASILYLAAILSFTQSFQFRYRSLQPHMGVSVKLGSEFIASLRAQTTHRTQPNTVMSDQSPYVRGGTLYVKATAIKSIFLGTD
jgi:hypothetical protein